MYEIIYQDIEKNEEFENVVKKVLTQCFKEEGIEDSKLCISIILTTPQNIQKINKQYRNIDNVTDVLSFPMFEKEELSLKIKNQDFVYEDILGDIIICISKVTEQAQEYGHTLERELSYMIVHGFYHLMGYDHVQDNQKVIMRAKEEKVLNDLKINRNLEGENK